jgi:tRNA (guanine-N(7)-)-methyltransferase subunit TRM82
MPKRLCAIALTIDQKTVLAGDKFGDVYALPLHQSTTPNEVSPSKPRLEQPKPFKPSASELTVHTKGNREALRQQQLQKASAPKRQDPTFEHQLILGHVSLLTDLAVGRDPTNDRHEYILTADRDEHIRVSRGIPQAHIINNYCHGHTEFVSKLCMVPERPEYLISGGGEPSLKIWNWLLGTIVAEVDLSNDVKQLVSNSAYSGFAEANEKRAVSCIKALYLPGKSTGDHEERDVIVIVVALEG